MFEELDPRQVSAPPAGALQAAMTRGRKLRHRRHTQIASGIALSVALLGGGFLFNGPLTSDRSMVQPAETPSPGPGPSDFAVIQPDDTAGNSPSGADFGQLMKITVAGDVVTLHVDRQGFYTGEEARARNGGEEPPNSYLTDDPDGPKQLTFTLDPKATIMAGITLQETEPEDPLSVKRITLAEFVHAMTTMPKDQTEMPTPLIWMRHFGGPDGVVTSITEQYVP